MAESVSSADLFKEINNTEFANYGELERKVLELFNRNLSRLPPHYSYLQLIAWGKRQGWIERVGEESYRVTLGLPSTS